ncbi:peptidoglycan-binding protein [Sinanaerobacter sp. ZZT-01]|uniref:peptidoglycan-binding protein n=1 Tax=Sinanaerobacter sp. ZZT-01 TaxID=3111540 RepID=UPI002D7707C4|nr:peptidoglycan-binding protein [Sinanaerobacter sp. ZZT-01]WRR94989.1 peptidoglycan-binding protein [Sinanaerobacter sp. ZZT-01]
MAIISRPDQPFIPEQITVHLGEPDTSAENITLSFPDYIKNVASSEIYPTWPESAIRANIYAQITFALNRIYTEWYRSRGYDFDITNSTRYDQAFTPNRDVFENISVIVDEVFNSYISREGRIDPLFTAYCDGRQTTCEGLSQWGTVPLAQSGYTPYQILQYYYGNDINIVRDVPINANFESYPLYPLRLGSFGQDVSIIQNELNRISQNYPSIPKIRNDQAGIFGAETEAAVKQFQRIFNLTADGIVGSSTWYKIKYVYNAVKGLGELVSEGISLEDISSPFGESSQEGDSGIWIKLLQYYIRVLGCYYPDIPTIEITGIFDPETTAAVIAIQKKFNLIVDGVVGIQTWGLLESQYKKIIPNIPEGCIENVTIYPGYMLSKGMGDKNVTLIQTYLQKISEFDPAIPRIDVTGYFDDATEAAVRAFQQEYLGENTGLIGPITWSQIAVVYENLS